MNYVVMIVFVGSLAYVTLNYPSVAVNHNLAEFTHGVYLPFTILWTCCLLYFFGFFGISFLDTDALSNNPETFGFKELEEKKPSLASGHKPFSTVATVPKPMNDTAICAELPKKPTASETSKPAATDDSGSRGRSGTGAPAVELNFAEMTNEEVYSHLMSGTIKDYQLEKKLGDYERAVAIRRLLYESILDRKLDLIPYTGYDYNKVFGANCEIVVGYVPIPLGIVGPLTMNGESIYVPMATTEGCLVASTNRGCKAISSSG
jgi:hypothetical protein